MKITIVIPTYNEAENIALLLEELFKVFKENKINGNVVVVDDNSPDGTAGIVKDLKNKKVKLIERPGKLGLGSAYVTGFKEALKHGSDVIFEMDADFSHKPVYIPQFLEKLGDNDLVIGNRYIKGGRRENCSLYSVVVGNGANLLIKLICNLPVRDVTTGFRVYKRKVLEKIDLDSIRSRGYEFQLEMIYKANKLGFKIGSIPIVFESRKRGKSKLSFKEIRNFFIRALELRFT